MEGRAFASIDNSARIRLDAEHRQVAWRAKESGAVRVHTFRRLTEADWRAYFSAIRVEVERGDGQSAERTIDLHSAALVLYDRAIESIRGYGALAALPPSRAGHKIQAVNLLMAVDRAEIDEQELAEPGTVRVVLDAKWGISGDKMLLHRGLLHVFREPEPQHLARYSRETNRSIVVPGSQTSRTIYPAREKVLVQLYDELVLRAEGYSLGDLPECPPLSDEMCRRHMDAFHKVAAAGALFRFGGEEAEEE